jgi:hypothetical protein
MKKKNWLAWFLLSLILVTPRIQIIQISGSFIRLEDFLFAINVLWLIHNRHLLRSLPVVLVRLFKTLIAMSLVGILSSLFAAVSDRNTFITGLFFSLRPLEYVTLVPTMYILLLSSLSGINIVLRILTIATVASSILQTFFAFQIGTSRFGFSRSSALTGGPYELAMISVLLLIYWLNNRRFLLAFLCLISLTASASRISILALGFALIILTLGKFSSEENGAKLGARSSFRLYRALFIVAIAFFTALGTSVSENFSQVLVRYESRIQNTESNTLTLKESYTLARSAPDIVTSQQYAETVFSAPPDFTGGFESSDASTRRRYFVWFVLIDTFLQSKAFIWGLGPGFAGSAVDGNFIRIVAEYGLLGIVFYWKWFATFLRRSTSWFKAAIVSVLVTGLYIDIFTSIKTSLLIYIFFLISNLEKKVIPADSDSRADRSN